MLIGNHISIYFLYFKAMFQEVWQIILGGISTFIIAAAGALATLWIRSRWQKRKERVETLDAEIDYDEKEVAVEKKRADRAWDRSETLEQRIDSLVKQVDEIRRELIDTKLELLKEQEARVEAEHERDTLRKALRRLIQEIKCECKGLDLTEYEQISKD